MHVIWKRRQGDNVKRQKEERILAGIRSGGNPLSIILQEDDSIILSNLVAGYGLQCVWLKGREI